jgi:hypothetical protein
MGGDTIPTYSRGNASGGSVGGNGSITSCNRRRATDVSGLLAAVALAGGKVTEDCGAAAAFGSGGGSTEEVYDEYHAGFGGGWALVGGSNVGRAGDGAVVLYFT